MYIVKYIIFLVSVLVFASTAFAQQQVRVPEGVKCPPNNLRACLNNLVAAYDDLFQETVAYKEVNAINKVVNSEITTCEANLADTNAILEEVVKERTSIKAELSSLRSQLSSSETDLASARGSGSEMEALYVTIEQLKNENSSLTSQLQLMQQQVTTLSSISQSSYSYEPTSSSSAAIVTTRVEQIARELAQARLQLDALLLENEALKAQLAQQQPQIRTIVETATETVTVYPDDYYALVDQLAQLQSQVGQVQTVVQTETVTVYPDDYHALRAENEQLRQALSSQAPMHTAPAPVRPAPAPEK